MNQNQVKAETPPDATGLVTKDNTLSANQRILQAGWGYYDVTSYPYGGSFHRAAEDTVVTIVEGKGQYPDEVKAQLPNGHFIIVKSGALYPFKFCSADDIHGDQGHKAQRAPDSMQSV